MQWLIDIIKDWIEAGGALTTSYIDRGDRLAYDYHVAGFARDNAWHDLDLSAIVPAGAKIVHLGGYIHAVTVTELFRLKKGGQAWDVNCWGYRPNVADIFTYIQPIVCCDTDRVIQYRLSGVNIDDLELFVRGWWL